MTADAISLPKVAVDVLNGQQKARDIAQELYAAYWLHGRDKTTAAFLLNDAHRSLHDLADAMGYTLTRKADKAEETVAAVVEGGDGPLFAAAPELLEALEGLADAYAALCEMTGKDYHTQSGSRYAFARAVIAKATGGAA